MSFLEFLNKNVLKDFGVRDFKLEEVEVSLLTEFSDNYKVYHYMSIVAIIISIMLYVVSTLQMMSVIPLRYESIIDGTAVFFFIMAFNAVIARWYNQVKYEKYINTIKMNGLNGSVISISPHNCVNYGKGKFIMLENKLVEELGKGELDVSKPLQDRDKVVTLTMYKIEGGDFTCDLEFDVLTKGVKLNAYAPADMYEEFHRMCINGEGLKK